MKIKTIKSIENYGIFANFQNIDTKDFGKYNIIFGWNYSGKTTLSRIFRSLEVHETPDDFKDGKFKIILDDIKEINETDILSNLLKIRVFNSDYIGKNLSWEQYGAGIPPILVVGEENIKLQQELKRLMDNRDSNQAKLNDRAIVKSTIEDEINNGLTDEARNITSELSLGRNFDRANLKKMIEHENIELWELPADDFKKKKAAVTSSNKLDPISEIKIDIDRDILFKTSQMLLKSVTPSKIIARLIKNIEVENWVRDGWKLHKGKSVCEFCQGKLTEDILIELDNHFSEDYEEFRKEVVNYASILKKQILKIDLKVKNDFYPEIQEEYLSKKADLEKEIIQHNLVIEKLIKYVEQKLNKLSESVSLDSEVKHNIDGIESQINAINAIIMKNEEKSSNFEKVKTEAIEELKKHYASVYYHRIKYAEKKNSIATIENELEEISRHNLEILNRMHGIESKISEAIKGADTLNKFIMMYFGNETPIEIKIIGNRFHIYRNDKEAKNLSEGEKTAISFSYFLAKLYDIETKETLSETIIYIDDPVSSLDNNHIYSTYSLISTSIKDNCGQLFVSTHNFEFFNLLKDEFKNQKPKKCDYENKTNKECQSNLFQIIRDVSNAKLLNIDCRLCHFKSEYQYLFYQLYIFYTSSENIDEYRLFTLPNILRRFLETYLNFAFSSPHGLKESFKKLITEPEELKYVHKIVDELSHNENTERAFKLYNMDEIKKAIEITLKAFDKDERSKQYLVDLKKSVGV